VGFLVPAQVGIGRTSYDTPSVIITSITQVLYVEGGPYSDSATFAIVTSVPTGELEFVHPAGQWGPFDTDNGQI
jgi:hypothetical protein